MGCLSVSLSKKKSQSTSSSQSDPTPTDKPTSALPGYLFIFLAALGTTGYTIIDSYALVLLRQTDPTFTPILTPLLLSG